MTPFESFLKTFVPIYKKTSILLNKAIWILETTGSQDAADLRAHLDKELRLLLSEPSDYKCVQTFEVTDPLLQRERDLLIRLFTPNQIKPDLIGKIVEKEAKLSHSFASFRAEIEGRAYSDNEIRAVLKTEKNVQKRKRVWEASKEVGEILAPQILELVFLRNEAARSLGYTDYFQMQLMLQDMNEKELMDIFEDLFRNSDTAYLELILEIEAVLKEEFKVDEVGPWAWSEPFCQEDPLNCEELDVLVKDLNLVNAAREFYDKLGINIHPTIDRSDLYEREGKNQHAFCMDVDREGDVRTLNNVAPSLKWLETLLHEFGHAIYDLGIDPSLPWLLREFPHIFTTEAMALLAGRQAYRSKPLTYLAPGKSPILYQKGEESLRRRQLIFSRWVLVMTEFERELYKNPTQELNVLWWNLVEKYQKIKKPTGRERKFDWAAKYHIGLAPVYYFSYLLGEMFASMIQVALKKETGSTELSSKKAGDFLQKKLFYPGSRFPWRELVKHVTGETLSGSAWVSEFGLKKSLY